MNPNDSGKNSPDTFEPSDSDAQGHNLPSFTPQKRRARPASSSTTDGSQEKAPERPPHSAVGNAPQRPHSSQRVSSTSSGHPPQSPPTFPPRQADQTYQDPHAHNEYGTSHAQGATRSVPPSYEPRTVEGTRAIPHYQPGSGTPRPHGVASSSGYSPDRHPTVHAQPLPPIPSPSPSFPTAQTQNQPKRRHKKRRYFRIVARIIVLLFIATIAWIVFLFCDANRSLTHVDALDLSVQKGDGDTYLIAGSDSRDDGTIRDGTEGARADSVILVNTAPNGQSSMISIPRDTYVEMPEHGWNKLNASYSIGGARLLVSTVEKLTGLTVDHFISVEMGGLERIIDALGGVKLCLDMDVSDHYSELEWKSGCHIANGKTGLAFSRMRYADPNGDIGRGDRQRQVVSSILAQALKPSVLLNPVKTLNVERAVSGALTVDRSSNVLDIGRLALAMRSAGSHSLVGTPPIELLGLATDNGSAVKLVDTTAPDFFTRVRNGTLSPNDFQRGM